MNTMTLGELPSPTNVDQLPDGVIFEIITSGKTRKYGYEVSDGHLDFGMAILPLWIKLFNDKAMTVIAVRTKDYGFPFFVSLGGYSRKQLEGVRFFKIVHRDGGTDVILMDLDQPSEPRITGILKKD